MKILLVRMSSMGDLVHTLPAIEDLSKKCPDIELHWLCEASFDAIARMHPFVKKVHTLSWRAWRKNIVSRETWKKIASLKALLKSENYDAVLDAQGLIKSAIFAKFANAEVWGFDYSSAREGVASWFYNRKIKISKNQHIIPRNRQLFASAFDYVLSDMPNVSFGNFDEQIERLDFLPAKYNIALTATSADSKLWAEENWRTLFVSTHQKDGLPILLPFGSIREQERANRIARDLPFVSVCPKLELKEVINLLQNSHSVIGVDTGLLHIANALNIPTVGIFTTSNPNKTGIQTTQFSENIGGNGVVPSVDQVLSIWQKIIS